MTAKKVLVTGITGMIGSHFAQACRNSGYEVFGIARSSASSRLVDDVSQQVIRCDVTDQGSVAKVFEQNTFDLVAHFAAQAFNSVGWDQPWYTHQVNVFGTLNILECVKKYCPNAKVLLACSSAEYGLATKADGPLAENRPLKPVSPYGVSKVATEQLGYQYFINYGLQVFLPRLFIHVGTGHPPATAIQNFARQIARIKKGLQPPVMTVGNLDSARDFIDVRDGVAAMMRLIESDLIGQPINVATGKAHSIQEALDILIKIAGVAVDVQQSKVLLRPSDEEILLGNNTQLLNLGWTQQYSFEETLSAVFADWMARV